MMPRRIKRIWHGLVDYVNANLELDSDGLTDFATIVLECMPWMSRTDALEFVSIMVRTFRTDDRSKAWFSEEAIRYQGQIRLLLRWMSDPKQNKQDRAAAFGFLHEHMEHTRFTWGEPAFDEMNPEHRKYWTLGGKPKDDFPHRTLHYKDIADPICDFILNEHETYHDTEQSKSNSSKSLRLVPVRICARPGCGKFIMPERTDRKKYCSDVCRASKDREERPDFKRCYQCLYRLEHDLKAKKVAVIRKKLNTSTTQHNLQELETRWPNYAERVNKIRARGAR